MSPTGEHDPHDWEVVIRFDKENNIIGVYKCDQRGHKIETEKVPPDLPLKGIKTYNVALVAGEGGALNCTGHTCLKVIGGMQMCVPC